jgi:hypothetical protein
MFEDKLMEHPVIYLARVTEFLDRMIEEHGDQLFVVFGFICLGILVWIFIRPHKQPVQHLSVIILPLGSPPRREPDTAPQPFDDRSGW